MREVLKSNTILEVNLKIKSEIVNNRKPLNHNTLE